MKASYASGKLNKLKYSWNLHGNSQNSKSKILSQENTVETDKRSFYLLRTQGVFLPEGQRSSVALLCPATQTDKTQPGKNTAFKRRSHSLLTVSVLHGSHQHTTLTNCYTKNATSNTKPLNPGSTDGPKLVTALVTSFWFRPIWSRVSAALDSSSSFSQELSSGSVNSCNRRDLPDLYLKSVSFKREPALCRIMSRLTCTSVFKPQKSPRKEKVTRD